MARRCVSLLLLVLLPACAREKPDDMVPEATVVEHMAERVAQAEGFSTPESVTWDADQNIWFVTNINGGPSAKDNNGFISRLSADGAVDSLQWVMAGRDGVTLHAPKGAVIVGDTLWVADIDAVRGFNRRTGAAVATIEIGAQATFLNDIAVGPDGSLYITDTGIIIDADGMTHPGPDRIFRVTGRTASVFAEGDQLGWPNGIEWDATNNRFVFGGFGGTSIMAITPDGSQTTIGTGPGSHDGVIVMNDGRVVVSSWADSSVFVVGTNGNTRLVSGVDAPAAIGYDPARGIMAIPLFNLNRVEMWRLR